MCGIWGEFGEIKQLSVDKLESVVKFLHHRGPDGYGYYSSPSASLVHTRLSIIDIQGGGQPFSSFDKRYIGIVNGEIYDYKEIRNRLQNKGVIFKTDSDSEVLLNLFAVEGKQALANVRGEYAFIFLDTIQNKVFFARDPFGVKPLYIYEKNKSIVLGSEIKAIKDSTHSVNEKYVSSYLCGFMRPKESLFSEIKHVYPGQLYEYDLNTNKISNSTLYKVPLNSERNLDGTKAIDKIENSLKASIKRRLVADVEVGTYLSGGVDSSLILAMMCDLGAKPKAFTVGFEDANFDESTKASSIAKHLGVKHEVISLNSDRFFDHLGKSILAFEAPVTNTHGAAKNLLSHLASKQVKVVLSGEGADEIFGGYAHHRLKKLETFLSNKNIKSDTQSILKQFIDREVGVGGQYLCGQNHSFEQSVRDVFDGEYPYVLKRIVDDKNAKYLFGKEIKDTIHSGLLAIKSMMEMENLSLKAGSLDHSLWLDMRMDLLHYILANLGDRQEMSNSLEGRTPFLDGDVIESAARLNPKMLMHGLKEKYILKTIANKYLPPTNANEKKHAFFAPKLYLKENRGIEFLQDNIALSKKSLSFLEWSKIERLLSHAKQNNLEDTTSIEALKMGLASTGYLLDQINNSNRFNIKLENSFPNEIKQGACHVTLL
jgi:asparagine synthase (glutamine-hydrolysing)